MAIISIEDRTEICKRYANGEKPGAIAQSYPGIDARAIGKMIKKAGVRFNSGALPANLITVDGPLAPTGLVSEPPPVPEILIPRETMTPPGPPKANLFENKSAQSPLFPTNKPLAIAYIDIERICANPESAGIGSLPKLDPYADEDVIRRRFGGGRYLIMAKNSIGETLYSRAIEIAGPSKSVNAPEPEPPIDLGPQGMFYPQPQSTSANPEMIALIRSLAEDKRRSDEQAQQRFEMALLRLKEDSERDRIRMKEDSDRTLQFMLQMSQQKEAGQAQVFATIQSHTMEHQKALAQIYTSQQKQPDILDDIKRIQALKELLSGEIEPKSSFDKVIDAIPSIVGNFMGAGDDGDDEETEDTSEPARNVPSESPKAATPPPAPGGARPISHVAQDLFASLVAQGVPKEKAQRLVSQGMQMLGSQVKDDIAAARKKAAATPAPAPETAPQPEAVEPEPEELNTDIPLGAVAQQNTPPVEVISNGQTETPAQTPTAS